MIVEWKRIQVTSETRARGRRERKEMPEERLKELESRFKEEIPDGWEMAETRDCEVA